MSNKITVSFSIPVEVKKKMERGAKRMFSTNTKYIVDLILKDDAYWFDNKEKEGNDNDN